MTLVQRIQELRKQRGLSQEGLGEALGVSRQAVSKWEGDNGIPELDTLIAMSRLFGITIGELLGVEEAFAVAPATLVGFTDMFIPALLIGGIQSVKTKFVIGALSLVQIIYLTEVGAIIIKSEIPLNLWKLFVLFLERTLIAIPLLVLCANIFL